MASLYYKGYAVRLLLEASCVDGDSVDGSRYYKLEAAMRDGGKACAYSAKGSSGAVQTSNPILALRSVDTGESLSSDQTATLTFNFGSEMARDLSERIRPMDRLRVEFTNGGAWLLAFDGFVSVDVRRATSTPDSYSGDVTIQAQGLWKFLSQSWFNWQGAIQPGYDVFLTSAGDNLYRRLAQYASLPGEDIIRAFIETALSLSKLKTSEGLIQPGGFFEFGTGTDWASAFDIAYPMPAKTLPSWRGPLVGLIQMMAQPDIHECFCAYQKVSTRERPTIIHRPRPFPGKDGDDAGWNALVVHNLANEPASRTIMANRTDAMHPNAFHWAQGAASDSGLKDYEQKILHGFMLDERSLGRYGYSARPVSSTMPPITTVPTDKRGKFLDRVQEIMERIAYQEAPLPELWTRTIQLPLRPGIHPGQIVEEYSMGRCWTGYVSTVHHRLNADPWAGMTTIGLVRCYPCTAKEYPAKIRALTRISFKPYTAKAVCGAYESEDVKTARVTPIDPDKPALKPKDGIPFGTAISNHAKAYGIPPWVLAHNCRAESGFGTKAGNGGGIMQFTKTTADGLNALGYGKPFSYAKAQSDPEASLDAAAWYIAYCNKKVPASLDETRRWAWTLYGYQQGPTALSTDGPAQGWNFTPSQSSSDEAKNQWGLPAITKGKSQYGGLS